MASVAAVILSDIALPTLLDQISILMTPGIHTCISSPAQSAISCAKLFVERNYLNI